MFNKVREYWVKMFFIQLRAAYYDEIQPGKVDYIAIEEVGAKVTLSWQWIIASRKHVVLIIFAIPR